MSEDNRKPLAAPLNAMQLANFKAIANAEAALKELEQMIPEKYLLAVRQRSRAIASDCMAHGEGGKFVLLHLGLTTNLAVCKGEM